MAPEVPHESDQTEPDRLERLFEALDGLNGRLATFEDRKPRLQPSKELLTRENLRGILTSDGQSKILHHVLTAVSAVVLAKFSGLDAQQATSVVTDSATQIGLPAGLIGAIVAVFQWARKDA